MPVTVLLNSQILPKIGEHLLAFRKCLWLLNSSANILNHHQQSNYYHNQASPGTSRREGWGGKGSILKWREWRQLRRGRATWASLSVYLYTPTTASVVKLREIKTLLFQPAPWPLTAENVSGKIPELSIRGHAKSVKSQYSSTVYFAVQGCHLLSLRSKKLSPWKQGVS